LPTSQPAVLTIYREDVKYGHNAAHETHEAGWPAAYAKVKSPFSYIAITSLTGANEAWFLSPYPNWKTYGDNINQDTKDPVMAAELARLSKADAEHVSQGRSYHLIGRADLSAGVFPSVAKNRFYEVTIFRVRLGHEQTFEQLAKVYKAAFTKAAPQASYRLYQVVAGMPGPTFMIFASTQTLAQFDQIPAMDAAVWGAIGADDVRAMQKFFAEGMINMETQRFAVNGRMSYVDDATAAQDPAFWRPGMKASN
jgi:hypothetical protein